MKGSGRLNILLGVDTRYCAECGAPEMDDGCSNSVCWRARPNARLPISLALQQWAIEANFPSGAKREGLFEHCFQLLDKAISHRGHGHDHGHAHGFRHAHV